MLSDLPTIFIWWLILFGIGLITLPLTIKLFGQFFDKGYAFSKILGLLFISYFSWLLPSLHLLKFNQNTIVLIVIALTAINSLILFKNKSNINIEHLKKKSTWLIPLFEELLFLGGLLLWSLVRAQEPSIHGLEKFMDFGFMNSIMRSEYFPPKDLWLTPLSVNYYYFGHLVASVLFKLSSIAPEIGYNLLLASILGFSLSSVFSLGFNLFHQFQLFRIQKDGEKQKTSNPRFTQNQKNRVPEFCIFNFAFLIPSIITGLIATFLVNFAGNLHTIYALTTGYPNDKPVPFWQLPVGWTPQSYWYPNATRFIPYTIHEFPIYSYVVADLHGHVLNIPFVLLSLALLMTMFFAEKIEWKHIIILPLIIASLYMTNALDGPIYGGIAGLIILYKWWKQYKQANQNSLTLSPLSFRALARNLAIYLRSHTREIPHFIRNDNNNPERIPKIEASSIHLKYFVSILWLGFGFIFFTLPFSLNFKLFVKGIGIVPINGHSPLYMLLILHGLPLFFTLSFIWFHFSEQIKQKFRSIVRGETLVKIIAMLTGTTIEVKKNFQLSIINSKLVPSDLFVFILYFVSFCLIIFPEFFFFKDIYPMHYRANTMFKLGYQAFIMFGICNAYVLARIIQSKRKMLGFKIGAVFLLFLVSIYPQFAVGSYYGNSFGKYFENYKSLDGANWIKTQYPTDYDAIVWIRKNIKGQPVILEGVGESYTDYSRISSFTGLPTVIGWPVHEWLWRGTYDEAGKRVTEMQQLYESNDIEFSKTMLKKYNVKYVYIGILEKQKYPKLEESKFEKLGKIIFNNGTVKIYEMNF